MCCDNSCKIYIATLTPLTHKTCMKEWNTCSAYLHHALRFVLPSAPCFCNWKALCLALTTRRLHRFVKNQLVVEITSSAKLAHLFGWIMRRHSLIAYSLYTAGNKTCERLQSLNESCEMQRNPTPYLSACTIGAALQSKVRLARV